MKKTLTLIAAIALTVSASAQSLNIVCGDVTYAVPASQAGDMMYTAGTTLSVMGKDLTLTDITKMYVDGTALADNTVDVKYDGSSAKVTIAGNIMRYVDATVSGANVSLTQSAELSDAALGEISYQLSGTSTDGSFALAGNHDATVVLNGLTLTSTTAAAIDLQNTKCNKLILASGTSNTLSDCSAGAQKACLYGKGPIEFGGTGSLVVTGNTGHAISSKEYITMSDVDVRVLGSVKDGINCNQYLTIDSGKITIEACGDDGIQTSFKDDVDREAIDTGTITINVGTFKVNVTATASKGIKADGPIVITAGTFDLTVSGGGKWDEEDVKTKASSCLNSDADITISDGTFTMTATGGGGKCISCDGKLLISGGTINGKTSGGLVVYSNGTLNNNYTGNSDNIESDYKSSPKAIKADSDITISGGNITITTTGNGGEGIESKAVMTITDGTIVVNAYDDCLNSSSHMYIKGGNLTCMSTNNDAIDSNGNMYIQGGYTRAFGSRDPEGGIDANEEEGYAVIISGGTLLATGRSSTPSSSGTQPYVSCSLSVSANTSVMLKSGSTTLASFDIPSNFSGTSSSGSNRPGGGGGRPPGGSSGNIIITCPGLTSGSSYTVTAGSSSTTGTAK